LVGDADTLDAVGKPVKQSTGGPRAFKQKRSAATYEALLDAAAGVFSKLGFDAAQTPEIAAEAGVSTGAFYRYFSDKRQIFVELSRRMLERGHNEMLERLDPGLFRGNDRRANIERAIGVLLDMVSRDRAFMRVYLAMSLRDEEIAGLRVDYERKSLEALTALIAALVPREVVPDARAAALVIQLATVEAAAERAGLRPQLAPDVTDAHMKRALREMIYRYMFP
jgi:AcrR family transcriptional regulator